MKICKDGRIWGQNNKEAKNHLGILSSKQRHIRKSRNPDSIGKTKYICLICRKEFTGWKCHKRKFCSNKCVAIHNSSRKHRTSKIEKKCLVCNKKFFIFPSSVKYKRGLYCSKSCKAKYENKTGCESRLWKGGISGHYKKNLTKRKWDEVRRLIYRRDHYTCQICGKNNIEIHAHHIVPYRVSLDDSLNNLIALCSTCHKKEEYKYYKKLKGGKNAR